MEPIVIQEQGSFMFGGAVEQRGDGTTMHGDHGYVHYQIPAGATKVPLILWHGFGQSGKTWEQTPDGREGFQNIFLRRGHPVYIVDQPRRGRAGQTVTGKVVPDATDEGNFFNDQAVFEAFRLGTWAPGGQPEFFENLAFPRDEESLSQFLRWGTPNTGPEDFSDEVREVQASAMAALFDRIGPAVLVIHSNGGQYGWLGAIKSSNVRAIAAYETGGGQILPESAEPEYLDISEEPWLEPWVKPNIVPDEQFDRLTRIPIQIIWGDNWDKLLEQRLYIRRVKQLVSELKTRGGDAELVELPKIGIVGNSHFPFSDLNNIEVADALSAWLEAKGLSA
ncbi:alpha/beta hydrolase [Microbacterium atlanticum]|uniref:alpha/beta hydrolase n=1 Tax=Microbacterium atlanticum TaxID=2782168 RepID=UPI00188862CE|nr:alpha/beta fold hydrolase [Microbacterium atlanticum]